MIKLFSRKLIGLIVFLSLVGGLLLWTGYVAWQKGNPDLGGPFGGPGMPPPGVIVSAAVLLPFEDRIEALGTAEANEAVTLTATVTEPVTRIAFEEGESVEKGDILVQLEDSAEQARLQEAERAYERTRNLARTNAGSIARREEEQARRDIAYAEVKDRQIKAPFSGIAGLRNVSVGDLVTPGTVITTINDIDPIKLDFTVPETFLPLLTTGLPIEAKTDAWPGDVFKGHISAIDPRINPTTRAVRVRAVLPNPDLRLRPGLLMTTEILSGQRTHIAIPEEALNISDSPSVLVVTDENKVEARPVTPGVRRAGYVEILSGLEQGERVIVEGGMKTPPGTSVTLIQERSIPESFQAAAEFAVENKQEALKNISLPEPVHTDGTAATISQEPAP